MTVPLVNGANKEQHPGSLCSIMHEIAPKALQRTMTVQIIEDQQQYLFSFKVSKPDREQEQNVYPLQLQPDRHRKQWPPILKYSKQASV